MTKLKSDIQTLLILMVKNVSSNEQQTEVANKQHEQTTRKYQANYGCKYDGIVKKLC